MLKQYLECGKIVSTHGIRGELRVLPWCDSPEFLCGFKTLYLQNGEKALRVERARTSKKMVLLKLAGFNSIDDAVTLRGKILYINRDDAPEDNATFIQDLIGIPVFDADSGRNWGKITDIVETGANDVYILSDENGKQRLIPAIPEVIIKTDLTDGKMLIRPLKGLFDDED